MEGLSSPLHLIQVGGDDVPQLPPALPPFGGSQLLGLRLELPCRPITGVVEGFQQLLPLLAHPLLPLPIAVKGVQHLAKGRKFPHLIEPLVLSQGQEGEVLGLFRLIQRHRLEPAGTDGLAQAQKALCEPLQLSLPQRTESGIHPAGGTVDHLTAEQRGQADEVIQDPLGQLLFRRRLAQQLF